MGNDLGFQHPGGGAANYRIHEVKAFLIGRVQEMIDGRLVFNAPLPGS